MLTIAFIIISALALFYSALAIIERKRREKAETQIAAMQKLLSIWAGQSYFLAEIIGPERIAECERLYIYTDTDQYLQ